MDLGVVINHHFILQYFFKLCWSCYCLLLSEVTFFFFFFSCNAGFFSQQYRAQELCGTLSKWCQYPPCGEKKKKMKASEQAFEESFSISFQDTYSQQCTFHKAACS